MSVYLTKIVSSYQFCKHYVNDGECISTYMIYNCNRMKYIIFRLLVSLYTLQHLYRLVNKRFKIFILIWNGLRIMQIQLINILYNRNTHYNTIEKH